MKHIPMPERGTASEPVRPGNVVVSVMTILGRWVTSWCCFPNPYCLLDNLLQCRSKRVCDAHDAWITGS